jgi:hypothetical protein
MNRPRAIRPVLLLAVLGAGAALIAAGVGPTATSGVTIGPRPGAPVTVGPSASASPSAPAPPPSVAATRPPAAAKPPPAAGPPLPQGWRLCVNPIEGFSTGYPRGWYTTEVRPSEVCRQFHPTIFEIPRESEYPQTALNVRLTNALPDRDDTEFERVLLWEETTVAGRPAVRVETESTGEGQHLAGSRSYGYTIRFGRTLLTVFAAAEPDAAGYADWKAVVDQAAPTVRRR